MGWDGGVGTHGTRVPPPHFAQLNFTFEALKLDRRKLKCERLNLLNQIKELYKTIESKENEIRDFLRLYETKTKETSAAVKRVILPTTTKNKPQLPSQSTPWMQSNFVILCVRSSSKPRPKQKSRPTSCSTRIWYCARKTVKWRCLSTAKTRLSECYKCRSTRSDPRIHRLLDSIHPSIHSFHSYLHQMKTKWPRYSFSKESDYGYASSKSRDTLCNSIVSDNKGPNGSPVRDLSCTTSKPVGSLLYSQRESMSSDYVLTSSLAPTTSLKQQQQKQQRTIEQQCSVDANATSPGQSLTSSFSASNTSEGIDIILFFYIFSPHGPCIQCPLCPFCRHIQGPDRIATHDEPFVDGVWHERVECATRPTKCWACHWPPIRSIRNQMTPNQIRPCRVRIDRMAICRQPRTRRASFWRQVPIRRPQRPTTSPFITM